jgi:hypothetical protein
VSVQEIQKAIEQLSVAERLHLTQWLNGFEDDEWDRQMKRDAAVGKFDRMKEAAEKDHRSGRCTRFP